MHIRDAILAKSNIDIILRTRGKIVGRRQMHNIFVNLGRQHFAYRAGGEISTYISQMGVGIGGFRQNNGLADLAPMSTYPTVGDHSRPDTDPTVTALERPVRISGSTGWPPLGTDVWLKTSAAPDHPASNRARFICVFTGAEISYSTFAMVPVSEIGLFLNDKDPSLANNQLVAYDAFDPIPKTTALDWEVRWTVIF